MNYSFTFFVNSILLGVGLAMDSFSVSMANGLTEPYMPKSKALKIAGTFGFFQALMPLVGWLCVHTILDYFNAFSVLIPWIALGLLAYIGGGMIKEGIEDNKKPIEERLEKEPLNNKTLLLQGIATAIDALSVGFTIAEYNFTMALVSVLIIGGITFIISCVGVALGEKFGTKLAGKAQILGGVILICIGLEIFISSFI